MIFVSKTCALAFVVFLASLISLINAESIQERNIYAWQLIQEIYTNYPDYIPKLLEYHNDVKKFNLHNETYKGYLRQMRRKGKYEILLADAYTYGFKNKVFESGKRPNTVLYQCDKAIRYCSGNPTYCEYHEGSHDSDIILISGHDGELNPDSIPDRKVGCFYNNTCIYEHDCEDPIKGISKDESRCKVNSDDDVYTTKIARWAADELYRITNKRPHLIVNNLHRHKIDMNRDMPLSTFNVPEANQAWTDYHDLIETAKANLNGQRGLILDIHGNDQSDELNMFGYGIHPSQMNRETLDPKDSTIRSLASHVKVSFNSLVRGKNSLGHFMQQHKIESIPSKENKYPGNRSYFRGGYTILNHGSKSKGRVDAIMVEIYTKYRESKNGRIFAKALADSVNKYYQLNYENEGLSDWALPPPPIKNDESSDSSD